MTPDPPDPVSAPRKSFKAIAAMAENRVIGSHNKIPWHLPEDFKWFKTTTTGYITVMGRKTFESLGKPLPNRINLILTRHPRKLIRDHPDVFGQFKEWRGGRKLKQENQTQLRFTPIGKSGRDADLLIFNSLERLNPDEFSRQIFICGGAEIYRQTLPRCSDLYLTEVKKVVEGDAFFPEFEDQFDPVEVMLEKDEFRIVHYRNRAWAEETR